MALGISELAQAREATASLLEELGLEAYLFEVEPKSAQWELKVDCAIDGGWSTVTIPVKKDQLLASREDTAAYQQLLDDWRDRFSACKVSVGSEGRKED